MEGAEGDTAPRDVVFGREPRIDDVHQLLHQGALGAEESARSLRVGDIAPVLEQVCHPLPGGGRSNGGFVDSHGCPLSRQIWQSLREAGDGGYMNVGGEPTWQLRHRVFTTHLIELVRPVEDG